MSIVIKYFVKHLNTILHVLKLIVSGVVNEGAGARVELRDFCLKDERLAASLKRATDVQVYSVDVDGKKLSKATFDPIHACELGGKTEMLGAPSAALRR